MLGQLEYRLDWTEIFDTSVLLNDFDPTNKDTKLLVDVGGNHGEDLARFLARVPDIPAGSLVLQDLPDVVAGAQVSDKIVKMAHNFFDPQPVIGMSSRSPTQMDQLTYSWFQGVGHICCTGSFTTGMTLMPGESSSVSATQ